MIDNPGPHFANVEPLINTDLKEFKVKIYPQVVQRFKRVRELYLRALRDHLLRRFPNIKLLDAFSELFDPSRLPSDDTSIQNHGVAAVKILCHQFGQAKPVVSGLCDEKEKDTDEVEDESLAGDPWDNPDFALPDVDAEIKDTDMDTERKDKKHNGSDKDEKRSAAKDTNEAVAFPLVNERSCLGELHSFRNFVLGETSKHIERQKLLAKQTADSESLTAAKAARKQASKETASKRKQAAKKGKDTQKTTQTQQKGKESETKEDTDTKIVIHVDAEDDVNVRTSTTVRSSVASAVDAAKAKAQPPHRINNLSMPRLIALLLNDPTMATVCPNIVRYVPLNCEIVNDRPCLQISAGCHGLAHCHGVL